MSDLITRRDAVGLRLQGVVVAVWFFIATVFLLAAFGVFGLPTPAQSVLWSAIAFGLYGVGLWTLFANPSSENQDATTDAKRPDTYS